MKLALVFAFILGIQLGNPFVEKLKQYEDQFNNANLTIRKADISDKDGTVLKLNKKTYYRIVPPQYETETFTFKSFDPNKFTDDIDRYYDLVNEQVMVSKPKGVWILNTENNVTQLTYKRLPGEFKKVTKIIINQGTYCGPDVIPLDTTRRAERTVPSELEIENRAKAKEQLKNGYIDTVQEIKVYSSSGTIEELSKDDYYNSDLDVDSKFALKKGRWKIVEEH